MTCERHPWGLDDGLTCVGSGEGHTHRYEATAGADLSEERRHADMEEA